MIFIDASFFIGLFVRKSEWHDRAIELWEDIKDEDIVISQFVIAEILTVWKKYIKPLDLDEINYMYNVVLDNCYLLDDYPYFNQATLECLNNELPFFDTIYIEISRELGIKKIISFDKHFDKQEGITRVH